MTVQLKIVNAEGWEWSVWQRFAHRRSLSAEHGELSLRHIYASRPHFLCAEALPWQPVAGALACRYRAFVGFAAKLRRAESCGPSE